MASTGYTAGKRRSPNKRNAGKREWYVFCSLGAWAELLLSPLLPTRTCIPQNCGKLHVELHGPVIDGLERLGR